MRRIFMLIVDKMGWESQIPLISCRFGMPKWPYVIRLLDIFNDNLMDQGICVVCNKKKFLKEIPITSQVSKVSSSCANTNDDESKKAFVVPSFSSSVLFLSLQYIHYVSTARVVVHLYSTTKDERLLLLRELLCHTVSKVRFLFKN